MRSKAFFESALLRRNMFGGGQQRSTAGCSQDLFQSSEGTLECRPLASTKSLASIALCSPAQAHGRSLTSAAMCPGDVSVRGCVAQDHHRKCLATSRSSEEQLNYSPKDLLSSPLWCSSWIAQISRWHELGTTQAHGLSQHRLSQSTQARSPALQLLRLGRAGSVTETSARPSVV